MAFKSLGALRKVAKMGLFDPFWVNVCKRGQKGAFLGPKLSIASVMLGLLLIFMPREFGGYPVIQFASIAGSFELMRPPGCTKTKGRAKKVPD